MATLFRENPKADAPPVTSDLPVALDTLIGLTPLAASKVNEIRDAEAIEAEMGLRLRVVGGGCAGFSYDLYFDNPTEVDQQFELQGVKVMSLNQLSDAVRPPVVSGQELRVLIRDIGREREQGISFLEDGTMVVVEDARRLIGQEVSATVTRVHQTQTGRIVFAHLQR